MATTSQRGMDSICSPCAGAKGPPRAAPTSPTSFKSAKGDLSWKIRNGKSTELKWLEILFWFSRHLGIVVAVGLVEEKVTRCCWMVVVLMMNDIWC